MRRACRFAQVVPLLLLAYLPALSAAVAEPVQIPNGGFEQVDEKTGLPVGWTPWAAANQCFYTLATAHSGVASAMITDDSATVSQGLRSGAVTIEPGKMYEATACVKIAELQAGGFALYLEYWCGATRVSAASTSCTTVGDWQPLAVSAPAPSGATTATVLVYGASSTVGVAYFDEVGLRQRP